MLNFDSTSRTLSDLAHAARVTLFIVAVLIGCVPSTSAAEAEVRTVLMTENEHAADAEWYCNAGACNGEDGRKYHCGYVLCGGQVNACGCTCISVSNAPYPKGFCGVENPLNRKDSGGGVPMRASTIPFNLY